MPVKAMKAPVRGKRSKAEMQQEFAEIQEQVESAREAADAKAEGATRLRAAEVRQAAEGITVEAVVQKLSGLGLKVGKAHIVGVVCSATNRAIRFRFVARWMRLCAQRTATGKARRHSNRTLRNACRCQSRQADYDWWEYFEPASKAISPHDKGSSTSMIVYTSKKRREREFPQMKRRELLKGLSIVAGSALCTSPASSMFAMGRNQEA